MVFWYLLFNKSLVSFKIVVIVIILPLHLLQLHYSRECVMIEQSTNKINKYVCNIISSKEDMKQCLKQDTLYTYPIKLFQYLSKEKYNCFPTILLLYLYLCAITPPSMPIILLFFINDLHHVYTADSNSLLLIFKCFRKR